MVVGLARNAESMDVEDDPDPGDIDGDPGDTEADSADTGAADTGAADASDDVDAE
jgi:hypothetical protein